MTRRRLITSLWLFLALAPVSASADSGARFTGDSAGAPVDPW